MLPEGRDYTFWGKGVSQGHSDAIRRVQGVKDARQYTDTRGGALEVGQKRGESGAHHPAEAHPRMLCGGRRRGLTLKRIEEEIVTMPNYFADYDTTVHFISEEELQRDHSGIPHGGFVHPQRAHRLGQTSTAM